MLIIFLISSRRSHMCIMWAERIYFNFSCFYTRLQCAFLILLLLLYSLRSSSNLSKATVINIAAPSSTVSFFFLLASSVRYFFFQNIISKYIAWVVRIEYALTRPIEHSCQVINHSRLFALANGLRFFCLPLQLTFRVFVPKKIWPFFNKYSSTLCMSAFVETYQHNVYFMMI